MDILSVVTRVPLLVFGVERHDDDFADRINYKYTVAILVIFAIIVTNRQFGTKQIHCWIPAYFTRNYEEYINDICWVSNTYYIPLDQKLPEADQIRKSFELKYYQWVPFILLIQAFFFYIPHIAWRALSRRSGIDVRDIVEAAGNYKSVDKYENRQKYMSYMLTAVDQYVDDPRRRKESRTSLLIKRFLSVGCCISGKFLGNYLMVLYLFIKLAFITNCISQLFLLNLLLGHEFHKFGFELIEKIINGKGWDTGSKIFPKISMCDFRIREVGNPKVSHRYTVQCVLPINLFNQQIYSFVWFWYCLVLFINIYSLCVWTYRFLPSKRLRYIKRRIDIMRQALFWRHKNPLNFEQMPDETMEMHEFEKEIIEHFVHEYLESDGLFILRILSSNTSDFVCTELIQELWKYYRKQRKFNRPSGDDDDDDDDDDLNEDEEDYAPTKKPQKVTINNNKNIIHQKVKIDSNIEEDDDDDDEDDDNDNDNDEESYNENKTNVFNRNLKSNRTPLPTEYTKKTFEQKTRTNSSTTAIRQKLRNKNLSRPLAALSGQIANMYKSKRTSNDEQTFSPSSKMHKINRTVSHDPKTLTSVNAYLVNPQLIPQYNNKASNNKPQRRMVNRKQPTRSGSLNELHEKSEDIKNETEEDQHETTTSPVENMFETNDDNKSKVNNNSVRLNSNTSEQSKSRYLETET